MTKFLPAPTLKPVFIGLICCILFGPGLLRAQGGGCECTNCPQFMPDLFVGPFFINVQNASNPILGQNGQGVCGVVIHFDHTAICDISITLTSPSGQTITLVGPIGQFCNTNGNAGTTWDVTFLPCGDPAVNPDPGFSATWNNNQPWGANNAYFGSYYPFSGCLQNFTGPVNGTWTLTVTDGQANDVGNLVDYEIIFCDPSGINCFSCAPNAGNLLQSDVTACQGDPLLDLDLPPTYTPPNMAPPAAEYGYTYVIGGAGGVIVGYDPDANLSGLPAGNYTVCGMSYLLATAGNIPAPNGSLTINQLSTQLNSTMPPFCGKITTNCVNVLIKPLPPDEEDYQTICAPACYSFHDVEYCQTGTYTQTLFQNGCPYTATLNLTVNQPSFKTVVELICPGGCSTTPGFAGACGAGQYMQTFTNAAGCDSTVTLNLVNISIVANIGPNPLPQLSCQQPTAQLSGAGSSVGAGVTYTWTAGNGGAFSGPTNTINTTITAPGNYQLRVCKTNGLITCCDSTSVTVAGGQTLPIAPAGITGDTILCSGQTASFSVTPVTGVSYTWAVPPGVTINSGQGSAAITATWNDTSGVVCVSAVNACGTSAPFCQPVSVQALANPVAPQGTTVLCAGDTAAYSLTPVAGATQYFWTVAGPATILAGQGTPNVSIAWGSAPSDTLCVVAINNCDTSQRVCLPVQINAVPGLPDIAGDSTICAGGAGAYTIPALANATGYNWTVPAGATLISGQDSTVLQVSWSAAPGGNVCVAAGNGCGAGPVDCFPVNVLTVPVADAGADTAICASSITLGASASVGAGMWTLGAGPGTAGFTYADSAVTPVAVSVNGGYAFLWTETNGICSDTDTVLVRFNASPQIGLPRSICDAANQNYTIVFPIIGGAAPFTVPGGVVVNDTFVSAFVPSGTPYSFSVTDSNGCMSPAISGLVNCNCATDAGQMGAQLLTACPGDSVTAQHQGGTLDGDDTGAYVLHANAGFSLGAILAENTTGTFGFGAGMSYGTTYYISYIAGNNLNGLPDLLDPCLSVAAGQPVIFFDTPPADAGADGAGCGLTLPVNGNPGSGTGVWSITGLPPGGAATLTDPLDNNTNLTATAFGVYTLTYTVSSNGCTGTDTVQLTFQASPSAGTVLPVCDGTNEFFTVSFPVNGGAAPYQVNGVPLAGANFVSAPLASGTAYSFIVTDANGCTAPEITGVFHCACSTNAGQMGLNAISACAGDTVQAVHLGGQNLDTNDTLAYVLHTGSGTTLGAILAQNHSGTFTFLPGMNYNTTYYISLAVGNNLNGLPNPADPCFSVAQGQPVVFYENPAPDAGTDADICGLTTTLAAANSGFSGTWSQVSGPGAAGFADPNDPAGAVTVNSAGAYLFRWTETNNICSASAEVMIDFFDVPVISAITETCNGTNTGYVLQFTVNGGTAPFIVSGVSGTFAGNVFSSGVLPNNGVYNVLVTDVNGCTAPVVSGSHFCPCTTDAGTMVASPAVFCAGQPATAVWNNDASLDADDSLRFILHNPSGAVYATSNQPVFPFGAGLQTGVTYYISAVAGNGVAGQIDFNDPCLDIAQGAPVQWKALPTSTLTGDATICLGSSTALQFAGTGSYPLAITYLDASGAPATVSIPGAQPVNLPVSPALTSTYTLVSVTDGTAPACTQALSGSATVTVNTPVNAGTPAAPAEFCVGANQLISLTTLLSGADPGGQWIETSTKPSLPGAFQAAAGTFQTNGQPAGAYTFRYTVPAAAPCVSQNASVTVVLHALPVADAGPDQTITCSQATVTLGGTGTGPGIYNWTQQGTPVSTSAQFSTGNGGTYTLLVTNAAGCTATDAVTVTIDNTAPVAHRISVRPVACFGDRNGRITLDSIVSSHPPVLFSLNGGPFSGQPVFSSLAPGSYMVTLQDANGCEWMTGTLVVDQPLPLSVDLGPTVQASLGEEVLLNAQITAPFSTVGSVTWNPVWDSLHADTLIQRFLPLQSSRVGIHLVDTSGCTASSSVLVVVDRTRKVFIPNIIKPGSTLNDLLVVYGGPDVEEVESFQVYDRWGEEMFAIAHFQPNDTGKGWDGRFKGQDVAPGVYVYYALVRFIDGESMIFRGDVTVFR